MKALFLLLSLILAPYGRTGLSLNGEWSAIVDQYDKGMAKGMYMDALPEGTTEFKEYAYDGGLRLQVPGDWNHQNPVFRR